MCPPAGRRPPGLVFAKEDRVAGTTELARYLARAASLESASVDAFRILRRELASHGTPRRLLRAAERAARDEAQHARATSSLARDRGATPRRRSVPKCAPRALEAVAVDNAVEGCVRETFGALVAMWQALVAGDARVRDVMARIAPDETRHAALSWRIASWAQTKLDGAARARVARAQRAAIRRLRAEVTREPEAELVRAAGLPCAGDALRMLALLDRAIWSGRA